MDLRFIPQTIGPEAEIINVKVAPQLFNLLELASIELGNDSPEYHSAILSFFLDKLSKQQFSPFVVNRQLNHGILKGKAMKTITFSGWELSQRISLIRAKSCLNATGDIIKLVILNIYEEVLKERKVKQIQKVRKQIAQFHTLYI
ncbi:hypothetical protein [Alteromonas sp. a30]|uniref:hypothetical protein n=1 Tax=Alteromonas sp. a30 TaxID=2730917 RepID=UPI002282B5CB|nr:hypothetical protein [Alteromonas sp. a30]MCY7296317.1 hypothetical protein [Alteromonas sp. a30]